MINLPNIESTYFQWISFYNNLEKKYGKNNAQKIYIYVWSKNGNLELLQNSVFKKFIQDKELVRTISSTEKDNTLRNVALIGVGAVFLFWLTTLFKATNVVFGFAKQITPDKVIKAGEVYASSKTFGLDKIIK